MRRLILSTILYITFVSTVFSQAVGEWEVHLSYSQSQYSVPAGNLVYVHSKDDISGSLYSYDTEDNSILTYDKNNYLSDNDITKIAYSKLYKTLIIVYENSNIDLLINGKETYNITDFMNKSLTENKTINNISLHNEYAYLSTNFGIVILDLKKKEITNTYNLGKMVYDCTIYNNSIYAATKEGTYTGDLKENLLDKDNWNKISDLKFKKLVIYNNELIGNNENEGVYRLQEKDFEKILSNTYSYMDLYDEKLILGNNNSIIIYNNNLSNKVEIENNDHIEHLSYANNNYWGSNDYEGLNKYKYDESSNKLINTISSLIPNSPRRNLFHYMTITGNRLLVAGGSLNYNGIDHTGTVMMYENGEWSYFQEEGIAEVNKFSTPYQNVTAVVQDPLNPAYHYVSTSRIGLFRFKDKEYDRIYTLGNSPLQTILPNNDNPYNYVSTNGLVYDNDNNLWIINNQTDSILKILKPDGSWFSFYHKEIAGSESMERILIDQRGWIWITGYWKPGGIFCLNTNNTLEDTTDDQHVFYSSFTNQEGESTSPWSVLSIAEDKNSHIWIGTNRGLFIINNFTNLFDEDNFYFTQIKVPRNDGTNNADILLKDVGISAICVDGANRKWIGTQNSGVYLLSEDGLETIHHFNTENSPLISNNIESMVINPSNGIIYIGTSKGLVSYRSDATEAETSFSQDAYAYPNPVSPDFEGVITVTGMVRDSDVKIVDSAGNLIYTNTSVGGQFTWNGKNRNGKRVASGVYFVIAADQAGKEGVITKIVMIK